MDIKNQFIVEDNVGQQNAEELAHRALRFGRVSRDGSIIFDTDSLSKQNQLKLALVIRYIANSLDESIPRQVRPSELTRSLGQRLEAIGSALSKLNAEGFAKREGTGKYSVQPYKIESFLKTLEGGDNATAVGGQKKKTRSVGRRNSTVRTYGVGADIQRLIEEGFFDTPKFIADVSRKLKEENAHHDDRVIDKTMRNTFVSSMRVLKRIPNEGSGKARWLYVIRK